MKKTVFLLLLFVFMSWSSDVKALDPVVYNFSDYEIQINRFTVSEGTIGYHIVKLGTNPFNVDVFYPAQELRINKVKEINGMHCFYGYTHNNDGDTYYDPFVLILDENGNEKFLFLEDFGDLEAIHDVVLLEDTVLIHVVEDTDSEMETVFSRNIFITYDLYYNELKRIENTLRFYTTSVENDMYFFKYDGKTSYDGAITKNLEYLYPQNPLSIETNQVFMDSVTITFVNDAVLNNERVFNGITVDYPGYYELLYNDFTYSFTVDVTVQNIEDNGVYNHSVSPIFEVGNAYLNNDIYLSGQPIEKPGNYTLDFIGLNGYTKTYEFTITSNMNGILDNQVYTEPLDISFLGDGYLNNTFVQSPVTIQDEGEYMLKIKGEGNYLETYYFEVDGLEEETTIVDFIQKFDVVFLGVVVIAGGIILKKK